MQDNSLNSLNIGFCWDNFPLCGLDNLGHTFHMCDVLNSAPCGNHVSDI